MTRFPVPIALLIWIATSVIPGNALAQRTDTRPDVGISEHKVQDFLLSNARVVLEPGIVIENANIWIEDGKITQVGTDLPPRNGLRGSICPARQSTQV